MAEIQHALKPGYQLDQYVIERVHGGGGFSIVYLARDTNTQEEVIIKEYMPRKLARRADDGLTVQTIDEASTEQFNQGRKLFFQEASTLANLKHPNIVNVTNFFRANGTVYMVMEYEQGINLQDYIKRHNGELTEKLILAIFLPLLDGLKYIHEQGMLHLDIKPGNIYLRPGANPLLLDFGAAHQMQQSRKYQPGQVVTLGFSPVEQSTAGGYVGPWSDIYAIGATMRSCIDGNAPPPAEERRMEDKMKPAAALFRKKYSPAVLKAIDWAMEVDPMYRPQSVQEFIDALQRTDVEDDEPMEENGGSLLSRLTSSLPWKKD